MVSCPTKRQSYLVQLAAVSTAILTADWNAECMTIRTALCLHVGCGGWWHIRTMSSPDCNDETCIAPLTWPEDLAAQEEAIMRGFIGWLSRSLEPDQVAIDAEEDAPDTIADDRFVLFNAGSKPTITLEAYLMRFQQHAKPGIEATLQACCLIQRLIKVCQPHLPPAPHTH